MYIKSSRLNKNSVKPDKNKGFQYNETTYNKEIGRNL